MGLLEKVLVGITNDLSTELLSSSLPENNNQILKKADARSAPIKSSSQILQIAELPLSLKLSEYNDAYSNANPKGDMLAALKFQQLVDSAPELNHDFQTGSKSIEELYGLIVNGATCSFDNTYLSSLIAKAKRDFETSVQSEFVTFGEWRIVEATPNDWCTQNSSGYKKVKIALDNIGTDVSGLGKFIGNSNPTFITIGNQQTSLSGSTKFTHCELEYMLVRFTRPWMNFTLFETAGWWLTGQEPGYCSSGRTDVNDGILPLITTGMILVRSAKFEGNWDPYDLNKVNENLAKGIDVYVGPFRLITNESTVSVVDVAAWISELVPFSPQTIAPSNLITYRFKNSGVFTALCRINYSCNGKVDLKAVTKISPNNEDILEIPLNSTDIVVVIRALQNPKDKPKDTPPFFRKNYAIIKGKSYLLTGTFDAPIVREL